MACFQIDGSNQLVLTNETDFECTSYVLIDSLQYQTMVQTVEIDPLEIAGVFGWAFGTVVFFWYLGTQIGVGKSLIKKV